MFGPSVTDALMALKPTSNDPEALLVSAEDAARYEGARTVLDGVGVAIDAFLNDGKARTIGLKTLDEDNLTLIEEALRQGEVSVRIGETGRVQETALPGVWRVQIDGQDWLEVSAIPQAVRDAIATLPEGLSIPQATALPDGAMNILPVLAEIKDKAAVYTPGTPNHEVVLTLLPMTPVDLEVLREALGAGPVDILSRGYGNCRIVCGARRNIWHLTFFNSEDKMILNTVQVGDVPDAALAAAEDLMDSRERLAEIAASYFG